MAPAPVLDELKVAHCQSRLLGLVHPCNLVQDTERLLIVASIDEVGGRLSKFEDEETDEEDGQGDAADGVDGVAPARVGLA